MALVLCLIGFECVVALGARGMMKKLRESLALTVVLNEDADSLAVSRLNQYLEKTPYAHTFQYVSKEQALAEHMENLGEDPSKFLGYNPLRASIEVYLNETYAHEDSIAVIERNLQQLSMVEDVVYQQDVVKLLDHNVGELHMVLVAVAAILLLMASALIVNTIRLHIYSKRFLINTMRLVGATSWTIKQPFVKRNVRMGFEAGVMAMVILAGLVYVLRARWGVLLLDLTWQNIVVVVTVVVLGGELIAFVASLFATGRYVRMKTDHMYEI